MTLHGSSGVFQQTAKSLSFNKLSLLNPPLKKGDIGGFAWGRLGKIPPHPLLKGGNIIYGQALNIFMIFGFASAATIEGAQFPETG